MRRATRSVIRTYLFTLTFASLLALGFRTWVLEPYRMPHSRLQPDLLPGDYLLVWKPGYAWARALPEEGDVLLIRAENSDFKVNVAKVKAVKEGKIELIQTGGTPAQREITPDEVLGKAWRIWMSIEPIHGFGEASKSWLSRLRFERFFKKVGV